MDLAPLPMGMPPMGGEPLPEPTFNVTFKIKRKSGKPCIACIPPDEALVPSRWNSVFLDDAPFFGHRPNDRTQSSLIAAGYDPAQVRELPTAAGTANVERETRFKTDRHDESDESPADDAMRRIDVCEAYIRADRDGDGIAELLKVTVAGEGWEILRWGANPPGGREPYSEDIEEVPEIPVAAITPVIMTHRFFGRSLAELVTDIQRIKTVLLRQILDNVYRNNFPMMEVPEAALTENTIDDLLSPKPRGIVRTAAGGHIQPMAPPVMIEAGLAAVEHMTGVLENRVGVTRYNQGLDADSLNKTATGINRIMAAAERKKMLIARIFAETGIKRLFGGLHGLLQRHSPKKMTVRLRNTWVEVDPRQWRTRTDMTVSVGLGTGNKDQVLGHLMNILGIQEKAMAAPGLGLVTPSNLYATLEKIVENAGLKSAAAYFTDPAQSPPQQEPEKPDPAMMQLQLMQSIEERRLALEEWKAKQADDRERDKNDRDFWLKQKELELKYNAQLITAEIDASVQRDRAVVEAQAGVAQAGVQAAMQPPPQQSMGPM